MNILINQMLDVLKVKDPATWAEAQSIDLANSMHGHLQTAQAALESEMEAGDMSTEQPLLEILDLIEAFENIAFKVPVKETTSEDAIYAALEEVEVLEEELNELSAEL